MLKKFAFPLLESPKVTAPGGGGGNHSSSGSIDDHDNMSADLAELNRDEPEVNNDDEEEETLEEGKKKTPDVEDDEEENGDENNDEEENDDEEENNEEEPEEDNKEEPETDPVKKKTYAAVKEKYPNFFKEFPQFKNDIFALESFRGVFPSVEEAKEAQNVVEAYNGIQALVAEGKTGDLLTEIKDLGEPVYKNFVANFLPSLFAGDKDLYYQVATPIVRSALKSLIARGKEMGGKIGGTEDNAGQNLINAALVAHMDLFNSKDIDAADKPIVEKDDKDNPDRKKLDDERKEFYATKYRDLSGSVNNTVAKSVMSEIERGLDPSGKLSTYVKSKLVEDIFREVDRQISKNSQHMNFINGLWKKEESAGFTGVHKRKIIDAVIAQAKAVIPDIRTRLRQEALKGTVVRAGNKFEQGKKKASSQGERNGNPGRANNNGNKKVDWSRTTDEDFLNDKPTYKN